MMSPVNRPGRIMRQKANEDPEFERLKAISDLAAIRVRIAAQRLRDRLRFEMRYNPDWQGEPRARPARQVAADGRTLKPSLRSEFAPDWRRVSRGQPT